MTQANIFIGLMSGTSLDGIDAVAVRFQPHFQLVASHSETIPAELKASILTLTLPGDNEIDLMGETDKRLGELFAKAVNSLVSKHSIPVNEIAAIGSHGQTIRHRPELGFTLQIGDPTTIAELTGITTIADFRRRDIAAGGQGAPLVPAFHHAMLQSDRADRILLNIGGMANLTYLAKASEHAVIGFDTGPGNVLIDSWIKHCKNQPFDSKGAWAATGQVDQDLFNRLYSLPYFNECPPKSTGREQFNLDWILEILAVHPAVEPQDVQRTLLELTATSITDAIKAHIPSSQFELYICGGGSMNTCLVNRIQQLLPNISVQSSDQIGIDADWMEAGSFCLAGVALPGREERQ